MSLFQYTTKLMPLALDYRPISLQCALWEDPFYDFGSVSHTLCMHHLLKTYFQSRPTCVNANN